MAKTFGEDMKAMMGGEPDPETQEEREALTQAQAEAHERALELLDWWEAFDAAWEALEAQGRCDGWGGAEYRRVAAQCLKEGVEGNQTQLRLWICGLANIPAYESVTEDSKRAFVGLQAKARRKGKGKPTRGDA